LDSHVSPDCVIARFAVPLPAGDLSSTCHTSASWTARSATSNAAGGAAGPPEVTAP
jgi:hypothetical protein